MCKNVWKGGFLYIFKIGYIIIVAFKFEKAHLPKIYACIFANLEVKFIIFFNTYKYFYKRKNILILAFFIIKPWINSFFSLSSYNFFSYKLYQLFIYIWLVNVGTIWNETKPDLFLGPNCSLNRLTLYFELNDINLGPNRL